MNREIASRVAGALMLLGAVIVTGELLPVSDFSVVVDSFYEGYVSCLTFGAIPCLILPLYMIVVLVTSKRILLRLFETRFRRYYLRVSTWLLCVSLFGVPGIYFIN